MIDAATLSLGECIERFGAALSRSDVDAALPFVADDLVILSLSDGLRADDRTWWERMVPHFALGAFHLLGERIVTRDAQAVHYRHARMTSTVGSAERSGVFCIADYWTLGGDGAWRVWQRLSVPVVEGTPLPEDFTSPEATDLRDPSTTDRTDT